MSCTVQSCIYIHEIAKHYNLVCWAWVQALMSENNMQSDEWWKCGQITYRCLLALHVWLLNWVISLPSILTQIYETKAPLADWSPQLPGLLPSVCQDLSRWELLCQLPLSWSSAFPCRLGFRRHLKVITVTVICGFTAVLYSLMHFGCRFPKCSYTELSRPASPHMTHVTSFELVETLIANGRFDLRCYMDVMFFFLIAKLAKHTPSSHVTG